MEATAPPVLQKALRESPEIVSRIDMTDLTVEDILGLTFSESHMAITQGLEQTKREDPSNASLAQTLAETMFGPLVLSREQLLGGSNNDSQREHSAGIQQNLIHALFSISEKSSDQFVAQIYRMATIFEGMTKKGEREGSAFAMKWSEIKAQLALMRLFKEAGYSLQIPNYNKSGEVLAWDVRSQTDFVAVPGPELQKDRKMNRAFLVDAKSRNSEVSSKGGYEIWSVRDATSEGNMRVIWVHPPLINKVFELGADRISHTIIYLSTRDQFIQGLDSKSGDQRSALRNLGQIRDPNLRKKIINELQSRQV